MKFIAAGLIAVVSIISSNMINQTLSNAQEKASKSYIQKRTEKRSLKDVETAKSYIFEKGNKIESIAKEIGIEHIMTEDKGLFYYSDGDLKGSKYTPDGEIRQANTEEIKWSTFIEEYSNKDSNKTTTKLYENIRIAAYDDFLEKEKFKDNLMIQFLHKYLVEIENQNIKYDKLLDNIQETAKKYITKGNNEEVRLQLSDGLYLAFNDSQYSIIITMNTAYKERVIKEVNPDIADYFISVKNSEDAKDRVLNLKKLNESSEVIELDVGGATIGTFNYNKKAYSHLGREGKINTINFYIDSTSYLDEGEFSMINYKNMALEDGNKIYNEIKNDIYNGDYKLPREEFVSKYTKYRLSVELDILPWDGIYYEITPGIYVSGGIHESKGDIKCNIPLEIS